MYEPSHRPLAGQAALNPDRLVELLGTDRVSISEILELAIVSLKTLVERLRIELAAGRSNDAHALAHEIKGVCANIGAEELATISADLQTKLATDPREPIDGWAASLAGAYDRFASEAKALVIKKV